MLGNHGAPRPPGSSPPPVNTVGDDIQVLTLNGVCGLAGDPGHQALLVSEQPSLLLFFYKFY